MPSDTLADYRVLIIIFEWIAVLYASAFVLRGIFSIVGSDFYNPVAQTVFKVTEPLVLPVRKCLPRFNQFDLSCWLVAWFINGLQKAIIVKIAGFSMPWIVLIYFSFLEVFTLLLQVYIFAIFILAISSWLMSGIQLQSNPLISLLNSMVGPILAPLRRIIPSVGVFDFTPLVALFILYLLSQVIHSLKFI